MWGLIGWSMSYMGCPLTKSTLLKERSSHA
jgi:hypothetical protein